MSDQENQGPAEPTPERTPEPTPEPTPYPTPYPTPEPMGKTLLAQVRIPTPQHCLTRPPTVPNEGWLEALGLPIQQSG